MGWSRLEKKDVSPGAVCSTSGFDPCAPILASRRQSRGRPVPSSSSSTLTSHSTSTRSRLARMLLTRLLQRLSVAHSPAQPARAACAHLSTAVHRPQATSSRAPYTALDARASSRGAEAARTYATEVSTLGNLSPAPGSTHSVRLSSRFPLLATNSLTSLLVWLCSASVPVVDVDQDWERHRARVTRVRRRARAMASPRRTSRVVRHP